MSAIFTDPEDDFTPDMARNAIERWSNVGPEREEQLQRVIKKRSDGTYRVPHASLDYGSDFHDQANYKIFTERYPWLKYAYLDADKMDHEFGRNGIWADTYKDAVSFHTFLAQIPDEDWERFLEDLADVKANPFDFAGDLVWELEQEACNEYWKDDGHWDLLDEICKRLDNSFHCYVVRQMSVEDTWEILRKLEMYPEAQGEASVWLDEQKVAEEFDFDDWSIGKDFTQYRDGWLNQKRQAWSKEHRGIFMAALGYATKDNPAKQQILHDKDDSALFHLLVQAVGDTTAEGEPGWRYHGWRSNDTTRWIVALADPEPSKLHESPVEAIERALALAAVKAVPMLTDRLPPPEDHPEFQFEAKKESEDQFDPDEDFDLQTAMDWIKMGGYDSADQIYRDDVLRVIIPKTIHTLQKYDPSVTAQTLSAARYSGGEIFIVIPADHPQPDAALARFGYGPFVVYEEGDKWLTTESGIQRVLDDPKDGPSLRKAFTQYYRKACRRDFERNFPFLLEVGGFSAVQRSLHKFPPGENAEMDLKIGLAAARRGNLPLAARYLNYAPELMTKEGFYVVYDDWQDTSEVFGRNDQKGARQVFDGEMDWLRDQVRPSDFEASDVQKYLRPQHYEAIRTALINREVETDEGTVRLTSQAIADMSDDDVFELVSDTDQDGTEDIRDAIQYAMSDCCTDALVGNCMKNYEKAVEDVLGPSSWQKVKGEDKLTFFIQWKDVQGYLERADEQGYSVDALGDITQYTEEAQAPENFDGDWSDNVNFLAEQLDYHLGELQPGELPEDPNQLEFGLNVPSKFKFVTVPVYSSHYPNGATVRMRETDYAQMKQTQPWRLDKELWDAKEREQVYRAQDAPPAPGLGESVDKPTSDDVLAYPYRWVVVWKLAGRPDYWNSDYTAWMCSPHEATVYNREQADECARWQRLHYGIEAEVQLYPQTSESLLEGASYKRGCAMIELPEAQADFLIEWGQLNIPDDQLYRPLDDPEGMGRVREIHVTVKYGFTEDVLHPLHMLGEQTPAFPVYLGPISLFRQEAYDVVKLDVESPWLRQLNKLASQLPNDDKWPTYTPHVTIAYVQKGAADYLEGQDPFEAEGAPSAEFVANSMVYKGATEDSDDPNRVEDHILFAKTKLPDERGTRPVAMAESDDPDDPRAIINSQPAFEFRTKALLESADPDAPERYVDDLSKRFAVYIDRAPHKIYADDKGYLSDVPRYMPMKKAVRVLRMAVKGGQFPVRLQPEPVQERRAPFDRLPFPTEAGSLKSFFRQRQKKSVHG